MAFYILRKSSSSKLTAGSLMKSIKDKPPSHLEMNLELYDRDCDRFIKSISVYLKDIEEITPFFNLLKPLKNKERLEVIKDKQWLKEIHEITIGAKVEIINHKVLTGSHGVLRYRGSLKDEKGEWFGIELTEEKSYGRGNDGTYKNVKFFHCENESAVFYNMYRIKICKCQQFTRTKVNESEESESGLEQVSIRIGDRIVWLSDNGPESGTVCWLGCLGDANGADKYPQRKITAGVEFDNPIGKGNGQYKGRQLFEAKKNHASLVPVLGLIKETEYFGIPEVQLSLDEDEVDGLNELCIDGDTSSLSSNVKDEIDNEELGVGDIVKVNLNKTRIGIVRYTGVFEGRNIIGLEMDSQDNESYTSGTFAGHRLFRCAANRGFFVHLHKCSKLRKQELQKLFGPQRKVSLPVQTMFTLKSEEFIGGIQGLENSTFIDTVLLALFATNNQSHSLVLNAFHEYKHFEECQVVQKYLINEICRPLKDSLFVRADKVLKLRVLIQQACTKLGVPELDLASEDIDPETFLSMLFQFVLQVRGFAATVRIPSESNSLMEPIFVHHLSTEVFGPSLPTKGLTVQNLFETNMLYGKLNLSPQSLKILVLKVHRSHKGEQLITPSSVLTIKTLLAGNKVPCRRCGVQATVQCQSCFSEEEPSVSDTFYCEPCFRDKHSSGSFAVHSDIYQLSSGSMHSDIDHLELFAVILKEGYKYTTFVRLQEDDSWYYCDSKPTDSIRGKYFKPKMLPSDIPQLNKGKPSMESLPTFTAPVYNLLTKSYMFFYRPILNSK